MDISAGSEVIVWARDGLYNEVIDNVTFSNEEGLHNKNRKIKAFAIVTQVIDDSYIHIKVVNHKNGNMTTRLITKDMILQKL